MASVEEGKAARSMRRMAGSPLRVPRREMRRPDWSWLRRRVKANWEIRDSAAAFWAEVMIVGVVMVVVDGLKLWLRIAGSCNDCCLSNI